MEQYFGSIESTLRGLTLSTEMEEAELTHTRICVSPNSKEAFGIIPKEGGPIQPLQDEHLELLTASNFKYRELPTQLDDLLSESDGEDLVLLPSDVDSD